MLTYGCQRGLRRLVATSSSPGSLVHGLDLRVPCSKASDVFDRRYRDVGVGRTRRSGPPTPRHMNHGSGRPRALELTTGHAVRDHLTTRWR